MRCKNCDYNLWALKTRECPECGRPFIPGEFEFVPGSVRFTCPHCEQSYYGAGANGHLVPSEFHCVSCGRWIQMDEMVLFPAEGVREEQTRPQGQPWLERQERGRILSWFKTMGMAMVAPQRLIRLTPVDGTVGAAWWFAVITQLLYCGVCFIPFSLLPLLFMFSAMRGGPGAAGVSGVFAGMFLFFAVALLVITAIWGLVAHAVLKLTGGTEHSLGRTYQAFCYGSGANVLAAIPCFGLHMLISGLFSIWWMVSTILMLKEGQRVHGGRATAAVLVFPVMVIGAGVLLGLALQASFASKMATLGTATMPSTVPLTTQVQPAKASTVHKALMAYAQQHGNRPPAHAIVLVQTNYLPDCDALLISDVAGRKKSIQIAGKTLASFGKLSLDERQQVVNAATAGLPPKAVAHRLGDFVFTYHGIDFKSPDPELWLFVVWPDESTGGDASSGVFTIGKAGGATETQPTSLLPVLLKEQNRLRARYKLAPLPDPNDVTQPSTTTTPAEAE